MVTLFWVVMVSLSINAPTAETLGLDALCKLTSPTASIVSVPAMVVRPSGPAPAIAFHCQESAEVPSEEPEPEKISA